MSIPQILYKINKEDVFRRNCERANVTKPRFLSTISDEEGEFVNSISQLKYCHIPNPSVSPLDLGADFDEYLMRDKEYREPGSKKLAKYLMGNHVNFFQKSNKPRIITTKAILKTIMNTPYFRGPRLDCEWSIKATKFKNIIFFSTFQEGSTAKTKAKAWFLKFHQYCFSESPNTQPKFDRPRDENKFFFGVFRMHVDDFQILYLSEIPGVKSEEEIKDFQNEDVLNECHFVSTKLVWESLLTRYREKWRRNPRLVGIWLEAYLSNIKTIYVGFKTDDGIVRKDIEQVDTATFPENQKWDPEVCKRFLSNFLKQVQEKMQNIDCPYTVFEISFNQRLLGFEFREYSGKNEHSFLSEEFIDFMNRI